MSLTNTDESQCDARGSNHKKTKLDKRQTDVKALLRSRSKWLCPPDVRSSREGDLDCRTNSLHDSMVCEISQKMRIHESTSVTVQQTRKNFIKHDGHSAIILGTTNCQYFASGLLTLVKYCLL